MKTLTQLINLWSQRQRQSHQDEGDQHQRDGNRSDHSLDPSMILLLELLDLDI